MAEPAYGMPQRKRRKGDSASSRPTRMKPAIIRFLPQIQSQFLVIPAEIRNAIYELIFQFQPSQDNGPEERPTVTVTPDRRNDANRKPSVLDLLTTCRQVHYEAETMFYGLNHLRYSTKSPHMCDPFIRTLRPRRQRAIKILTIICLFADRALDDIIHNVKLATNLQVLHIELPVRAWDNDELAMNWARDVQTVLAGTAVSNVRILQPDTRAVKTLGSGGSNNNSYIVSRLT
jgi:hypothetical protein